MENLENKELIGIIAGILTTSAYIPQTIKVIKSKSAKDFSWIWLIFMIIGILLWFLYGLMLKSLALIFANGISIMSLLTIAVVKYVYRQS
ncbi:SemiSWEET transporter [Venenivibrio stagnispumantis]|uniref:SemiSWEET family sugar transporter n=1 Tax=Venenivibrio stagnispumantis TaxID=407998 RepID=UPI0022355819|nr:SemiSWEET family transporter [Venenivibrio stagnispumantis]MCW4572494.1 SemiSWEET family transporter [Venenivibrio stagnispumantis]